MINILIPLAGKDSFFCKDEYLFPKPLIEFEGKTMIEHVLSNFNPIAKEKQFVFVINNSDCKKYHLDNVLSILTNHTCKIVKIDRETKGAACSAMLAAEYIDNDFPLIISNADQLFDINLHEVISFFEDSDAGVITFESIHPRWSYARVSENNGVVETAEKNPISKHAIAGFYYFKHGKDFISSSSEMIRKGTNVNGSYYISPSLNEMILKNKSVVAFKVENNKFHTVYSPQKIKEYERSIECLRN